MPVLAIVGQQAGIVIGTDYQQEVDLVSLYKDVARNFVHMAAIRCRWRWSEAERLS